MKSPKRPTKEKNTKYSPTPGSTERSRKEVTQSVEKSSRINRYTTCNTHYYCSVYIEPFELYVFLHDSLNGYFVVKLYLLFNLLDDGGEYYIVLCPPVQEYMSCTFCLKKLLSYLELALLVFDSYLQVVYFHLGFKPVKWLLMRVN